MILVGPVYLFSLIDGGSLKSVTVTASVAIDSSKKREDDTLPQAHGMVEDLRKLEQTRRA